MPFQSCPRRIDQQKRTLFRPERELTEHANRVTCKKLTMRQTVFMQIAGRRTDGIGINFHSVDFTDAGFRRQNGKYTAAAVKFNQNFRLQSFHDADEFRCET